MRTGSPPCRCSAFVHDGPLPRLVRVCWRLLSWFVRWLAHLVAAIGTRLPHLPVHGDTVVLVQVANTRRAAVVERALHHAIRRHTRAFDFRLTEGLVVLVHETVDPSGERTAVLERESRPDGSTRHVLQLAVTPSATKGATSLDGLLAELGRQLVLLQRNVEGISCVGLGEVESVAEVPLAASFRESRPPAVVPFPARNGHYTGPFDRSPDHA